MHLGSRAAGEKNPWITISSGLYRVQVSGRDGVVVSDPAVVEPPGVDRRPTGVQRQAAGLGRRAQRVALRRVRTEGAPDVDAAVVCRDVAERLDPVRGQADDGQHQPYADEGAHRH